MTEQQKYFGLLSRVYGSLPTSAIDKVVLGGFPLGSSALAQVRVGRTINLRALVALIEAGLPNFSIPDELLPDAQPAELVPSAHL